MLYIDYHLIILLCPGFYIFSHKSRTLWNSTVDLALLVATCTTTCANDISPAMDVCLGTSFDVVSMTVCIFCLCLM